MWSPAKLGVDVMYLLGCWQQDIPDTLCHSLIGTSEPSPLVLAAPATKPQPDCQVPSEEALLQVGHFFFLLERLHTSIERLHSVLPS
jgi:hypothetical protein